MTRRTSEVAACCSSASLRSRVQSGAFTDRATIPERHPELRLPSLLVISQGTVLPRTRRSCGEWQGRIRHYRCLPQCGYCPKQAEYLPSPSNSLHTNSPDDSGLACTAHKGTTCF